MSNLLGFKKLLDLGFEQVTYETIKFFLYLNYNSEFSKLDSVIGYNCLFYYNPNMIESHNKS